MLVCLITLDCVRNDYVGESRGLTPHLDALRGEWTTFSQAFAQSQNTLSSHLSMLTSNYLFQHGVYSNYAQKELPAHALPRRLAERGWACRAFTSIDFLALLLGNQVGPADPRFPPAQERGLKARLARRWHGQRSPAAKTLDRALRWLKSADGEDLFLWVHLFDAHMVYEAPSSFLDKHVAEGQAERTVRQQFRERGWFSPDFPEYGWKVPLEHFPQRYAAAVAYLDHCLGRFFAALKAKGWWEESLVMVTADHGECLLGDHGVYCAHKKLFDTTVHVPLRVKFPGGRFAGERVDALVQHVDLAPTVAALAGFEEPLYMGRDLAAVASGASPGHEAAFAEHVDNFMRAARDRDWVYVERVPGAQNKWGLSLEDGDLFTRGGRPAPAEARPQADRLKAALDSLLASGRDAASAWGGAQEAGDEVAQRLKSLGYL
jgi:arylsulfatase A-like enzyme